MDVKQTVRDLNQVSSEAGVKEHIVELINVSS